MALSLVEMGWGRIVFIGKVGVKKNYQNKGKLNNNSN